MAIEITNVANKGPKGDPGQSGAPLIAVSGVPIKLINPLVTFTGLVASDNGAGKVLLTGAGSHGLTAADAVGAHIYVLSGTGWTAGTKKILSLDADNGNAITLDVPFASQGSPTISLGSTASAAVDISIPALGINGVIRGSVSYTLKSSANNKSVSVRSSAQVLAEETNLTNIKTYRLLFEINNRGATNSQIGLASGMPGGAGPSANDFKLTALDFSAGAVIRLGVTPYPAEPITVEKYLIEAFA